MRWSADVHDGQEYHGKFSLPGHEVVDDSTSRHGWRGLHRSFADSSASGRFRAGPSRRRGGGGGGGGGGGDEPDPSRNGEVVDAGLRPPITASTPVITATFAQVATSVQPPPGGQVSPAAGATLEDGSGGGASMEAGPGRVANGGMGAVGGEDPLLVHRRPGRDALMRQVGEYGAGVGGEEGGRESPQGEAGANPGEARGRAAASGAGSPERPPSLSRRSSFLSRFVPATQPKAPMEFEVMQTKLRVEQQVGFLTLTGAGGKSVKIKMKHVERIERW